MYRALFALAYYGMFRIGELAKGDHPILAKDVLVAANKKKILIYPHTSKMHGLESKPQKVEISAVESVNRLTHFCPFELVHNFIEIQDSIANSSEQFFVFRDRTSVKASAVRATLRKLLKALNLNNSSYQSHSFRIGRCCDLIKAGFTIEQIKLLGHWKSNAVFRYIR